MDQASLRPALVSSSFLSSSVRRRACSCRLFSTVALISVSGVGMTEGLSVVAFRGFKRFKF